MTHMDDWISRLLEGYLPGDTIVTITNAYEEHQHVPLRQLGLESVAVMGLVLNIESSFGRQIDYGSFDISVLETLARAKEYLNV